MALPAPDDLEARKFKRLCIANATHLTYSVEMIGEWVKLQREKYGPDWKAKVAAEMTDQAKPLLELLFPQRNL